MTQIIVPRRREEWFDRDGNFTHQAFRFFEDLTEVTNSSSADIEVASSVQAYSSQSQWLQKQINGLPKFTCDTTGFTADSTEWTADKDTA